VILRLVDEWKNGVVPRLATAVVDPPTQNEFVVELHPDAVVDRQERCDVVTAVACLPVPDLSAHSRRLEPGSRYSDVKPQLIERVWTSTTHVAAELATKGAEDRLQRVRVSVS